MTLKKLINRFCEQESIYIGGNVSVSKHYFYLIDWFFAYLFYGASISDYFGFAFYEKRRTGRKKYITYRKYKKIQRCCNDLKSIEICRNKKKFNMFFSDYVGREWIDVDSVSFVDFEAFVRQHKTVFLKEINGFRGNNVRKLISAQVDCEVLFRDLRSNFTSHYILEEEIKQISSLSDFHPWSINTIRIVTLFDSQKNVVHIMNARIRIGNNKNSVDNLHYGGIGANIDIESGVVNSMGRDARNNWYVFHPITHKQIVGFQVPFWSECIDYVNKAARLLPTVRYVGWDIVIQDTGKFLLIEANDNADHDFQQFFGGGLWGAYKSIIG